MREKKKYQRPLEFQVGHMEHPFQEKEQLEKPRKNKKKEKRKKFEKKKKRKKKKKNEATPMQLPLLGLLDSNFNVNNN